MAAKSLTPSNREILKLHSGLKDLVGAQDKEGIERFDFDLKTAWNLAKCLSIVERAVETYERAKRVLAAKLGVVEGQKLTDENAPKVAQFLKQLDDLKDQQNELSGLLRFKVGDIQKAGNIPHTVLANIMPLLDE